MLGFNTGMITAKVIGLQSFGDRADESRIRQPMGQDIPSTSHEASVVSSIPPGGPLPARAEIGAMRGDGAELYLRPEAGGESFVAKGGGGKLESHRKVAPFGVMQPEVSCLAAASILPCAP